ncbi:peptide MFS transporter [Teredinibacter purpureus]|uniref:peptide MFS transporter n=1 Tax=Teredinibacter purpureus TaxID=2731756 RepID=UPI0005F77263|nr:peptide MFS transporter [Teredinibacter purpureus]
MSALITKTDFLGHPKGLFVCFTTELWERFSFYGMKYLLLLYVTKYHLFSDAAGYDILGAYAGLVYTLPLVGGLIADRYLGMRKAVIFGALLLTAGHATMAFEGTQAISYAAGTVLTEPLTLNNGEQLIAGTTLAETVVIQDTKALRVFFFALALITLGVGFLKPNISAIVGRLYTLEDGRRDAGYTIYYMGINTGSFAAIILCGWLGETYGWNYGFGAAGIGMLLGLCSFLYGQRFIKGHVEPENPEKLTQNILGPLNLEWAIYLLSLLSLSLIWWVIQHEHIVHITQNSLLIVAIVGLIFYSLRHDQTSIFSDIPATTLALLSMGSGLIWATTGQDIGLGLMITGLVAFIIYGFNINKSDEYSRTVVLMFLILTSVVFWALFEQSAGSMTLFADRVLDRSLGDGEIRASMFGSLNPGFIMLLGLPLAYFWTALGKRGLQPNTAIKFGLGIIQAGLGFGALVIGAEYTNDAGKVAAIWMVLAYLLHTTGELCLSPVGLSAVSKLSIQKVVGVSMGTWFLATALSETISTRIGKLASIDTSGVETATIATMLTTYTDLYTLLMWIGIAVGTFVIAVSPLLKKGMRGVE